MKYAGLLVMPAGFFLCVTAIVLFSSPVPRTIFVISGLIVELIGLGVTIRAHMAHRGGI